MNKKAYTLVEIMVSLTLALIVIIGMFNFYNVTRQVYSSSISRQTLEQGANLVLSKMIEGGTEPGGVYRLMQGVSYCIGAGVSPSCHTAITSELHFWGPDGIERWYHLNSTNTSLLYHHPMASNTQGADEMIYTAPRGTTITLLFWIPAVNYSAAVVGASVTLTQNVLGATITGSATTLVNLRNHP